VLASFLGKRMAVEYLGQVNILALVSILLLSVLAVLNRFLPLTGWIVGFALGMITFFMIKEYFRRMRYAGLYPANKIIVGVNLLSLITFLGYVFH
jgi:hypothetical protein